MPDKPDLAALIGSRICHDLISPIGAISNGVELLAMDGSIKGPEMALISESVANANARIRFFRIAFGGAGSDQRIGRPEVQAILSDLTRGGRLSVVWNGPAELPRREVKLVFLLIQCLESALPFGGRIEVTSDGPHWSVTGEGTKLKPDAALWQGLSGEGPAVEVGPAQVQFALAPVEAARIGRPLKVTMTDSRIAVAF